MTAEVDWFPAFPAVPMAMVRKRANNNCCGISPSDLFKTRADADWRKSSDTCH